MGFRIKQLRQKSESNCFNSAPAVSVTIYMSSICIQGLKQRLGRATYTRRIALKERS